MREKSMTWLVGSCKAKEIRESPGRGTVAISALGLMVLVALLPAVDAAQGGGGNGGENCTWDVEKIGSPRKPGYTEVTTIYCDNPFAGSTGGQRGEEEAVADPPAGWLLGGGAKRAAGLCVRRGRREHCWTPRWASAAALLVWGLAPFAPLAFDHAADPTNR